MLLLDTSLRLLATGQLLLIALVVGRSAAPRQIRTATVALMICIAAYLINVAPVLDLRKLPVWAPVQLASQAAPFALWIFAHRIFERPVDRRLAMIAAAIIVLCWGDFLYARFWEHRYPIGEDALQHGASLLLAAHAIVIAWQRRGDDLIERRRTFRVGFVILVGFETLGVILAEIWYGFGHELPWLMIVQSGGTVATTTLLGGVLLSTNAELLFDRSAAPAARPALSPAEHVLKLKLEEAMGKTVYREPGLTIGVLAERLSVPEHRLRALINQRLGYRNFSDFLNIHRIGDARAWLADPKKVDLPVLTLAMDLGYGSLAPFNRAFRDLTGQTPTDFRRAAILAPEKP